jgi:hypothetical protein
VVFVVTEHDSPNATPLWQAFGSITGVRVMPTSGAIAWQPKMSAGTEGDLSIGVAIAIVVSYSFTVTVFTSVYCCKPYSPSSRPMPDCLKPPKGARVSSTL